MVWPLLPLVAEGALRPSLIAALLTSCACIKKGLKPYWGLGVIPAFALFFRVRRALKGPSVKPAGRCSREEYQAKADAVKWAAQSPGPLRMYKATASNTFRPHQIGARLQSQNRLDLSGFTHVLEVNTKEMWCDVEACATFETYAAEVLKAGMAPLVVPELRTITVGGAVVGIGIESSSFKHGFFHEALIEADLLLPSGDIVTVKSSGDHAELFRAIPNSLGSFGYLLRLRLRIQEGGPYVRLEKKWFDSPGKLISDLEQCARKSEIDFVDAVALSDQGGMVMSGQFAQTLPEGEKLKSYTFWPQFYKTIVVEGCEYMTTVDYYWRWDADWFWCSQIFPGLCFRFVRWLVGANLLRSDVYKAFNDWMFENVLVPLNLDKDEEYVIQDIEIPVAKAERYINEFLRVCPSQTLGKMKLRRPGGTQCVPIWLCPVKGTSSPLMPMKEELYINFGFWDALTGEVTKGGTKEGRINKALEKLTIELGGIKTLYSTVYFTQQEFYNLYNGDFYKKIKDQYDPNGRVRGWFDRLAKV